MPKKYIVGSDVGHGETAAWVVPLEDNNLMDAEGQSLKLKATNNVNDRVLHSVVYQSPDGTFSLEKTLRSNIIGKMKAPVGNLRNIAAYRAYIKLVVEAIIKNNSFLTLKDDDGEPNFYICMASPTKWNTHEKDEYLRFFNEAVSDLGISFKWIINESDAAFFSHRDHIDHDKMTLVVDYGSSTIDYTVMLNGKKVSRDEWSNGELGAGTIEKDILNSYRENDYEGYQRSYNGTLQLLESTGNGHVDVESEIDYECRCVKEKTYTDGREDFSLDYHLGVRTGEKKLFSQFRFEYDVSRAEVTASYRRAVENDLRALKSRIEEATGRNVDTVILSGGACIMNWVNEMVFSIFPDSDIVEDYSPSYVVARGIALYAKAQYKALQELLDEIGNVDYATLYRNADTEATKDTIRSLSDDVVKEVYKQDTCIRMVDCFNTYISQLDNDNSQYVSKVKEKVGKTVTQNVRDSLKATFERHFNWTIDASEIEIDVNVNCLKWAPTLFNYSVNGRDVEIEKTGLWSQTVMKAIENILGRHKVWFIGSNWTNERDADERKYLSEQLVDEVLKEADWLDSVSYGEDDVFLKVQAQSIREQALEYAERIFYDKQLFRTTFAG